MTRIEALRAALAESDLSEPMKDDAARLLALYDAAKARQEAADVWASSQPTTPNLNALEAAEQAERDAIAALDTDE